MLKRFIERPVLSTVISVILVLLGVISLLKLPITLFPNIAPPSVLVTATYPGANAEVVARSVATPLEEAINGVENMTYMTSNSSNDGTMQLTVYFKQGTNPDLAAVNVQNRVSTATSQIPQDVIQGGITTQKQQNSIIMVVAMSSTDSNYDEVFLQNYIKINLIPQIQRIPGVAQASVFGTHDYSMRIWLRPDRLIANNLTPQDVTSAIKDQSLESAPGRLGESSNESFEYVLKYKGKLNRNEDYENIVIKANPDGATVRLKDVARVEFGSYTYSAHSRWNNGPGSGFAIIQTAGSNANDILTRAESEIKEFSKTLPRGVGVQIMYNSKEFLDASIAQVRETLLIAFGLVFLVVFIFLQDFRSTLIPAIAVPVAIVGTFFFLQLFGFTINLLTLFALVLAIGIVVDDAIVVVEAVHAKIEGGGISPKDATVQSMSEISGAIVSITMVMAAVFVPVGFMQGPAGVFYRQFAFTLASAILISAINALTLTPALAALFLKGGTASEGESGRGKGIAGRFSRAFNAGFKAVTGRYSQGIQFLLRRKWVALAGLALITFVTVLLVQRTPTGFIPTEDQGFLLYSVRMPPGSSLDRTHRATLQIDSIVKAEPMADKRYVIDGLNLITDANASSYAQGFVRMKPYEQRGPVKDLNAITGMMMQKASTVKDANTFFFTLPTIQGFGNVSGFEFMLQDRTNGPLGKLSGTAWAFIGALMRRPEIAVAFTTFSANNPQYQLVVDDVKARQLGVKVADLMQTLQVYYGSSFVDDFNRFGKYYRVMAQAEKSYRSDSASLNNIYVRNDSAQMIPASSIVSLRRVYGPETVTRNNLFNAVTINGTPKPGYSTGDAIRAIDETARQALPRGYGYEYTGMTREEISAGSQMVYIFLLSVLFVYLLLSAQYESYILPFAVILTVPAGIFGVYALIDLMGIESNIYVQVGLLMLVGLLAKNAILIVEYAVQRRRRGMSIADSALEAAKLRLRPILMTSFAFIVGLLPLMSATGASALGNRSIGTGAVGGMLAGVLLGIFIIPVLYAIFQYLQEKITRRRPAIKALPQAVTTLLLVVLTLTATAQDGQPQAARSLKALESDTSIGYISWKAFFTDSTLQSWIDKAIKGNYDLRTAVKRIEQARATVKQARASAFPTLSGTVSGSRQYLSGNTLLGMQDDRVNNFLVELDASWEIDVWRKIRTQKEIALANYLQSYEAEKAVQSSLVAEVANDYFNLLMLDKQLEIAKKNLKLSENTVFITRLQKQAGDVTELAVEQADVQRQATAELMPQLEQQIAQTENAIRILAGETPAPIQRSAKLDDAVLWVNSPDSIPVALVGNRPDVREKEFAFIAADGNVALSRKQMYPVLNITASGGWNSMRISDWFSMPGSLFGTLAGSLTQPILQHRQLKTNYEVSKIQRDEALIDFKETTLNATGDVANDLISIEKLKMQRLIAAAKVDTALKAVEDAQLLFRSGLDDYLEVITAQTNALTAELDLATVQRQQLSATVGLYQHLGGGWK